MKKISIDELKSLQLEILIKVHDFCIKNNLRYFLEYGTLIGAIRHKGYIPWDEDIDIGMPRPDYDKFVRSFNGYYKELTLNAPELDWNFFESYANVYDNRTVLYEDTNPHNGIEIGVKIDVFPLDGVPSDYVQYQQLREKLRILNMLRGAKKETLKELFRRIVFTGKGIKTLLVRCKHPFSTYIGVQKEMRQMATQYKWEDSEFVDQITFQKTPNTRLPRCVYEQFVDVPFENHLLKVPVDYDSVLKIIFGDYMKLPPEHERVYQHGFTAYWKD